MRQFNNMHTDDLENLTPDELRARLAILREERKQATTRRAKVKSESDRLTGKKPSKSKLAFDPDMFLNPTKYEQKSKL